MHRVKECELMRFNVHVEYIIMISQRAKKHEKDYSKFILYHLVRYIETKYYKNCKHIFVVPIYCWDLAFISKERLYISASH